MNRRNRSNGCLFAFRKFFLSAFVVISFLAYALEKRMSIPVTGEAAPTVPIQSPVPTTSVAPPLSTTAIAPSFNVTATTPPIIATATSQVLTTSGYKDGTYTGPSVYINWGYIQVQATIQSGRISDVEFLEYPNERRTSVRINSVAIPELQQEAIQAQSANVDIISGATLTSEGFQASLQSALGQAQS